MKIKVLFHLRQAGFGGTEKAVQTFCENIDRSSFVPYLFCESSEKSPKYYLDSLRALVSARYRELFSRRYVVSKTRLPAFKKLLGEDRVGVGGCNSFYAFSNRIKPDIVHFNRGGSDEPFTNSIEKLKVSHCVETNIFGKPAFGGYLRRLDKIFFVSRWLLEKSTWHEGKGRVLYNPIKLPLTTESLRRPLGIPAGAFVMGRITRPDLFDDDFIVRVFDRIAGTREAYLIVIGATDQMRQGSSGRDRIIIVPPTIDEWELSRFFNTIDLLLHRRIEGETFGMNIAEAMMHGKPVVSHRSETDNAQAELLDSSDFGVCGFVAANPRALDEYCGHVERFASDVRLRASAGEHGRRKALRLYHEKLVTGALMKEYETVMNTRSERIPRSLLRGWRAKYTDGFFLHG